MKIIIRGGGDLGSGVALRLHHVGWQILICETDSPLCLRRSVSFANAVYEKETKVEGVLAIKCDLPENIFEILEKKSIPVLIDPEMEVGNFFQPDIIIDARMLKKHVDYNLNSKIMIIGLGPGFIAGKNCHAVIETNRGHFLGRVIWEGEPQMDTGSPGRIKGHDIERVLRSPSNGKINSNAKIGYLFIKGETIGFVGSDPIIAPFDGCLRGLMHNGIEVSSGLKIGDLDARMDPSLTSFVSEKALAIAGGVLEAILIFKNR